jgi:ceramide glucosyltransferase
MHPVQLLVLGCSIVASGYQLFQVVAAHRFFRRARREAARQADVTLPPVTLLKPLKGEGIDLYANLASFCRQDYPAAYQIVCGVADPSDPAAEIVRRLKRDFPHRDIVLSVGSGPGANRKVGSLIHMMGQARHEILVMSDADIRVRPDYLRAMVTPLAADPRVGLTTCLYRGRGYFGRPSVLESLFINTDFIPMVLTAHWVQGVNALGASIALRRAALDQMGGFVAIRDFLADDNQLGIRAQFDGWHLTLLPYVVETVLDSTTMGDVWRHQFRWARTYRVCQPVGWFASVVTHAMLWGTAAVIVTGGSTLGWAALGAAIVCRVGALAAIMRLLKEPETPRHLWLVPFKDLCYSGIWLLSWFGKHVTWSNQVLRVDTDGRMAPVRGAPAFDEHAEAPDRLRVTGS